MLKGNVPGYVKPKQVPQVVVRKDEKKESVQFIKLEARIAPTCHTNPQGKQVGDCGKHGGGGHVV